MAEYESRVTQYTVSPPGRAIYDEQATVVEIDSETAGEFVTVSQQGRENGKIAIDPQEWPALREAIDKLIGECRDE